MSLLIKGIFFNLEYFAVTFCGFIVGFNDGHGTFNVLMITM